MARWTRREPATGPRRTWPSDWLHGGPASIFSIAEWISGSCSRAPRSDAGALIATRRPLFERTGSTQMLRCAIFFVSGCVLRTNGFNLVRGSFAACGVKP